MATTTTERRRLLWKLLAACIAAVMVFTVYLAIVSAPSGLPVVGTECPSLRNITANTAKGLPTQPLVIVTALFNADCDMLEKTAHAVATSTFPVTWVIVDDHSSEPLCDVASQAALVVQNTGPRGLGPARQFVLDQLGNDVDYTAMLDGDDLIVPEAYEKAVWVLETQRHMTFVGWHLQEFGHTDNTWEAGFHTLDHVYDTNIFVVSSVVRRDDALRCSATFRLDLSGGMEDWEYWLQLIECGMAGHTIPTNDFWYRTRDPEIRKKRWPNLFVRYEETKKYIQGLHTPLRERTNLPSSGYGTPFNSPDHAAVVSTQPPRRFDFVLPGYVRSFVATPCRVVSHTHSPSWVVLCAHFLSNSTHNCSVLFLLETMHVSPLHTLAVTMARALVEDRGCTVTLATSNHDPEHGSSDLETELRFHGVHVFVLPSFCALGDQVAFLGHLLKSRRINRVVILEQPLGLATVGHLRHLFDSKPAFVAVTVHPESNQTAAALPYLDGVLVPSKHDKERLVGLGHAVNASVIHPINFWSHASSSLVLELMLSIPRRANVSTPRRSLRASLTTVSRPETGVVDMLEFGW